MFWMEYVYVDGQNGKNDSLVAVFRLVAFLFSVSWNICIAFLWFKHQNTRLTKYIYYLYNKEQ